MGGEVAKPLPPVAGGEVGIAVAEDGGMEVAGARLSRTLVLEVVDGARAVVEDGVQAVGDGVRLVRRATPPSRPSRPRRRRPPTRTPRLRSRQTLPGVKRAPRGARPPSPKTLPIRGVQRIILGVPLLGAQITPGVHQVQPYRMNLQVVLVPTKGRGRKRRLAFRAVAG